MQFPVLKEYANQILPYKTIIHLQCGSTSVLEHLNPQRTHFCHVIKWSYQYQRYNKAGCLGKWDTLEQQ